MPALDELVCWAVHSVHVPAVRIVRDDAGEGYRISPGSRMLGRGSPLFTAETREEAEQWREAQLRSHIMASALTAGGPGLVGEVTRMLSDGGNLVMAASLISSTRKRS